MKIDTNNLVEDIKKSRPNIKDNTIKQYQMNLNKLQTLFDTDNYDFLSNVEKVMDKISGHHFTSQRNFLNAIIILLMALNSDGKYDKLLEKYGKLRDDFNDKYNKLNESGKVQPSQAENFATIEEVYEGINKMGEELKPIKKKKELSKKEMQLLQAYILFNMYARYPVRLDYAGMYPIKKRPYTQMTDEESKSKNWLLIEKNKLSFILNNYKSNKTYGQKIIEIEDKDLKKLLRYYLRINGMGVLFKTSTGKPITRIELSKILLKYSKIYIGKQISATLLRKAYMSSKYSEMKDELLKDNYILGHSKEVALNTYVKKAD